MKGSLFQHIMRAATLCGLAITTVFGTAITLSSCGGGGSSGAVGNLYGTRMELYAGSSCQVIEFDERITKTSSTYRGVTSWGDEGNGVNCLVTVDMLEYDESGSLTKMVFRMSFNPGYAVSNSDGFKSWWGIGLTYTGVSMRGVPEYTITLIPGESTISEGSFTVKDDEELDFELTWPNGGSGSMRNDGSGNPTGWAPPANGIAVISHS